MIGAQVLRVAGEVVLEHEGGCLAAIAAVEGQALLGGRRLLGCHVHQGGIVARLLVVEPAVGPFGQELHHLRVAVVPRDLEQRMEHQRVRIAVLVGRAVHVQVLGAAQLGLEVPVPERGHHGQRGQGLGGDAGSARSRRGRRSATRASATRGSRPPRRRAAGPWCLGSGRPAGSFPQPASRAARLRPWPQAPPGH